MKKQIEKFVKTKIGNIALTIVAVAALVLALPFMERPK